MAPQAIIQVQETIMNHRSHNIIHVPIAIQQGIWKIIAEIPILVSNVVEKVLLKSVVARNLHLLDTWVVKDARVLASIVLRYLDIVQHVQKMVIHTKIIAGLQKLKDNFPSPPFRAILSFSRRAHWLSCCAHGGFFVCLGVEEWERWTIWVGFRCGAVASALLRQSRDTAEALSEMFCLAPCALSEGRAQSLGLLQYSQYCHHSLIRARCGWLLLRFYHR